MNSSKNWPTLIITSLVAALALLTGCGNELRFSSTFTESPTSTDAQRTVTPSGTNVSFSPATRSINAGETTTFTVTPSPGYAVSNTVGGTCPEGSWSAGTYTTGTINQDCTVIFNGSTVAVLSFADGASKSIVLMCSFTTGTVSLTVNHTGESPATVSSLSNATLGLTDSFLTYTGGSCTGSTISNAESCTLGRLKK